MRCTLVIAGSFFVAAAFLGGCSSSSDSGGGSTPVTADQACTDAIGAFCLEATDEEEPHPNGVEIR